MRKPSKLGCSPGNPAGDGSDPTTAANYLARWSAFANSRGGWHVLRSNRARDGGVVTPAAWRAWVEWMETHGIPTAFCREHGILTVPAQWPEEFDSNAPISERYWSFPSDPIVSPEQRARVLAGMNEISARLSAGPYDPRARDFKTTRGAMTPSEIKALADSSVNRQRADNAKGEPWMLSDRARATFGMPPRPPAPPDSTIPDLEDDVEAVCG